jgi:hypothetical protein
VTSNATRRIIFVHACGAVYQPNQRGGGADTIDRACGGPPITQRTQAAATNLTHIRTVQVKPLEPSASAYRFRLRDGEVDLMKSFSLSSEHGIGAFWQGPLVTTPHDATFEERFGRW